MSQAISKVTNTPIQFDKFNDSSGTVPVQWWLPILNRIRHQRSDSETRPSPKS
jgi:hypothetical protein